LAPLREVAAVSKARLIITAVVVEGRTKSEVARDYEVSRYWVQQLVRRYARGGPLFGRQVLSRSGVRIHVPPTRTRKSPRAPMSASTIREQ
jgi:hypothetical protein